MKLDSGQDLWIRSFKIRARLDLVDSQPLTFWMSFGIPNLQNL